VMEVMKVMEVRKFGFYDLARKSTSRFLAYITFITCITPVSLEPPPPPRGRPHPSA
jgi:hypothetical protein